LADKESLDPIAVVIPALNEEKGIGVVIKNLKSSLTPYRYMIVVVDGYSKDRTVEIAKQNGAFVIFQNKQGYGDALHTGFRYAKDKLNAKIIIMMDADGTYDPSDCFKLVQPILKGKADLVVGKRIIDNETMPILNRFGNSVISWLVCRLLGLHLKDTQSGMYAFHSDLVDYINLITTGWAFNTEILHTAKEASFTIREVPISYKIRIGNPKLIIFKGAFANLMAILRLTRMRIINCVLGKNKKF